MKKILNFLKKNIKINNSNISLSNINGSNCFISVNGTVIGNCEIDKEIKITLNGNLDSLDVIHGNITVNGDVSNEITLTNGNINIEGSVDGNISTVNGSIDVAQSVNGDVETVNGNIKYKK